MPGLKTLLWIACAMGALWLVNQAGVPFVRMFEVFLIVLTFLPFVLGLEVLRRRRKS